MIWQEFLTEKVLKECWHEWVHITPEGRDEYYDYNICKKCKEMWSGLNYKNNRTFTTWQDTGDLKERIVEMGEWRDFALFAAGEWDKTLTLNPTANFIVEVFTDWLMDEIRFPELVAGWWWQEREVKG